MKLETVKDRENMLLELFRYRNDLSGKFADECDNDIDNEGVIFGIVYTEDMFIALDRLFMVERIFYSIRGDINDSQKETENDREYFIAQKYHRILVVSIICCNLK